MRKHMWQTTLIALMLAGCAQLPPTPQDIQAKKFESVPGKAVIYIVRAPMDSSQVGELVLDDTKTLTTYRDTYYRWVVAPGKHRIAGYGHENAVITLDADTGKVYFIEHTVLGDGHTGAAFTFLNRIDAQHGRAQVLNSELLTAY